METDERYLQADFFHHKLHIHKGKVSVTKKKVKKVGN